MRSIFELFFNSTSLQQKKLIISITVIFGLLSPGLIGIAVWFKEPFLQCQSTEGSEFYDCSQEIACSHQVYSYFIEEDKSPDSLGTKLSLICDRKSIKRMLISAYFFGGVLGCVINILVYIPAKRRKLVVGILGILHALANLGIALLPSDILLLAILLAALSFTWIIIHSYCFMVMNENFQGDLAKTSIMIMMIFWGFSGIVYSFVAYVVNANYYILFLLLGIIGLVAGIYLVLFRPDTEPKALSKMHRSIFGIIKQMWPYSQIRFNIITFVISWSAFCVTYNDVFLKLETIGGSLFLNMGLISTFEMSASFISGIISLRFDIHKCIKMLMLAEIVLGVIFLFAPIEVKHLSAWEATILLVMMIFTKFFSDIINNLINLYAPKVFTDEFISIFLILSRLSSRLFLLALPTVNYSFESFRVHPFFFLTILWGLCYIMAINVKEIQEEGIHDVLAEFKVGLAARVSVIHNSEHLLVDDNLSNIMVDDKRLSEIRSSRIMHRKTRSQASIDSDSNKGIEMASSQKEFTMGRSLEKRLIN